jgi:hypothetical protein
MRTRVLVLTASVCAVTALVVAVPTPPLGAAAPVTVQALPHGGIQPQAVVDATGTVHVVYFSGDPAGGDLYYIRLIGATRKWTTPVRVNSVAASALATGSVRGAQLTLGRDGRVHVAWHGSKPLDANRVPMWYTRAAADGAKFEAQRSVSGTSEDLDGGTVAADRAGHVAVAWHAKGAKPGEGNRTVYLSRSSDDGATFSAASPATEAPVGACGCCGMRALFDRSGALHVLYRAATDAKHRDTTWLMIDSRGAHAPVRVHAWDLEMCPMTTYALAETGAGVAAAWETAQQIYSADLDPATGKVAALAQVPGQGSRKHPSIAVNASGDRLLAWTEGTAWKRGGTVAWRLTDPTGTEKAIEPNAGPVPAWGLVSAVTMPDGSFVIFR